MRVIFNLLIVFFFLGIIATVIQANPALSQNPIIQGITSVASGLFEKLPAPVQNFWNTAVAPVFTSIHTFLKGLWDQYAAPAVKALLSQILGLFGQETDNPIESLKNIITGILKGLFTKSAPSETPAAE
ncbi:MAG: hypothetical protein HY482_02755 [Candidatus Wildermuthbacteria bacterium]|nr:hypothetical protein [Candidatus Wildermuthbacteria bacterium]